MELRSLIRYGIASKRKSKAMRTPRVQSEAVRRPIGANNIFSQLPHEILIRIVDVSSKTVRRDFFLVDTFFKRLLDSDIRYEQLDFAVQRPGRNPEEYAIRYGKELDRYPKRRSRLREDHQASILATYIRKLAQLPLEQNLPRIDQLLAYIRGLPAQRREPLLQLLAAGEFWGQGQIIDPKNVQGRRLRLLAAYDDFPADLKQSRVFEWKWAWWERSSPSEKKLGLPALLMDACAPGAAKPHPAVRTILPKMCTVKDADSLAVQIELYKNVPSPVRAMVLRTFARNAVISLSEAALEQVWTIFAAATQAMSAAERQQVRCGFADAATGHFLRSSARLALLDLLKSKLPALPAGEQPALTMSMVQVFCGPEAFELFEPHTIDYPRSALEQVFALPGAVLDQQTIENVLTTISFFPASTERNKLMERALPLVRLLEPNPRSITLGRVSYCVRDIEEAGQLDFIQSLLEAAQSLPYSFAGEMLKSFVFSSRLSEKFEQQILGKCVQSVLSWPVEQYRHIHPVLVACRAYLTDGEDRQAQTLARFLSHIDSATALEAPKRGQPLLAMMGNVEILTSPVHQRVLRKALLKACAAVPSLDRLEPLLKLERMLLPTKIGQTLRLMASQLVDMRDEDRAQLLPRLLARSLKVKDGNAAIEIFTDLLDRILDRPTLAVSVLSDISTVLCKAKSTLLPGFGQALIKASSKLSASEHRWQVLHAMAGGLRHEVERLANPKQKPKGNSKPAGSTVPQTRLEAMLALYTAVVLASSKLDTIERNAMWQELFALATLFPSAQATLAGNALNANSSNTSPQSDKGQ